MNRLFLSGIFILLIIFPSYVFADGGPYLNIPPTNAFDKIRSDNGTVTAVNFSMPLNIKGGSGISVKSQNGTHTVTITNTQTVNSHTGTYNQTLANNVVKNSGGNRINFLNGTNNPVTLTNDPTRNQINVTISSTGSGSGVTSLNALTGALTIACVAGNTTCTTSGGNTITVNTAYNVVVTNGATQTMTKPMIFNNGITMSNSDIALGGNKIKTTNFQVSESSAGGNLGIILASIGSGNTIHTISPTGADTGAITQYFRTSDITTNYQMLQVGSDFQAAGRYGIWSLNGGTGTAIPIDIGIQANSGGTKTKLMSFDTANTITSYVNHIFQGGLLMSNSDIALGGNKIKTTNFQVSESSAGGNTGVSLTVPGLGNTVFNIYPGGANTGSATQFFRTSDVATNWEMMQVGSDFQTAGHYSIYSLTGGTSASIPIDIGMQAPNGGTKTKLMSFDTANTITSYVQNIWTPIADVTGANSIWKSSTNADVLKYRNNADTITYNILSTLGAVTTSTPADPTGTTSTTAVMMGLAGSITPAVSTRADITICGQMANSLINDGVTVQLRYGTGTAPTNGAALTGTQLGASQTNTEKVAAQNDGYCVTGIATGLTIGTTYWIDTAVNAVTAGTATIAGNTIKAHEI